MPIKWTQARDASSRRHCSPHQPFYFCFYPKIQPKTFQKSCKTVWYLEMYGSFSFFFFWFAGLWEPSDTCCRLIWTKCRSKTPVSKAYGIHQVSSSFLHGFLLSSCCLDGSVSSEGLVDPEEASHLPFLTLGLSFCLLRLWRIGI